MMGERTAQVASLSPLEEPFELAGIRLRNRMVHASMTTFASREGKVTEALIRYFENRAKGGAAMIVSEPLSMSPMQDNPVKLRVWNDDDLEGLQRWARAIEAHDCRLLGQIQDPGRARHFSGRYLNSYGPSAIPDDMSWSSPRALTLEEIRALVIDFAQSSARLQRCGFSGVELSVGHGHLFHQFLSPYSNHREDLYGGSWANRVRFVQEIIAAVREACGASFIIGLKLPGDDGLEGSIGMAEAAIVTELLTASGQVNYFCYAQGTHAKTLDMHVPDRFGARVPYLALMQRLRASAPHVPFMALGRITDPAEAEGILQRGEAELIGLGRTLIADPAWPLKARTGRTSEIRYCVSCNTCWEHLTSSHQLVCVNNPRVSQPDEVDYWPSPTQKRRKVVVIGAGLSGMEAAWVAAAQGHDVTVLGRGAQVGGKAFLRAGLPGGEEVSSIYDYQAVAAQKAGVRIELGVEADLERIRALEPDVVVLATGATMFPPPWLPPTVAEEGWVPDLRQAMASLGRVHARQPGTAVVYDMDHSEGTYASAEHLHALFDKVVIVTPRPAVATEMSIIHQQGVHRRLARKGIEVVPLSEPVWTEGFEEGVLMVRHVYSGQEQLIDNVGFIAYATPRIRNDGLAAPLRALGIEVHLVGDCLSPRGMVSAAADGSATALRL